jgi:small subunit ribosomal protein S17
MNKKTKKSSEGCEDKNCPIHGELSVRGRTFVGTIISTKMHKTVVVEWLWKKKVAKYERYESKRTRLKAHNPQCISAQDGDIVKIAECRPLSKTKNFVIIEVLGKERGFKEKIEAREEGKFKKEGKDAEAKVDEKEDKNEEVESSEAEKSTEKIVE